jgi:pyrroloquinoline quinone (PQQ) biosynthesis protein C
MSFHHKLLSSTADARAVLQSTPVLQRALRGEIDRALYRDFLIEAFHHVRHTTPLLMACGARLAGRLEWLRDAVAHYIAEEVGHQAWILDDLVALGESRERCASTQPAFETEMMVAYAWDTVQRGNPVGFFGMVLVLEGTSAALASHAAAAIESGLGLPRNAFSYLRSHGELDQEHIGFFAGLMDRLEDPLDQQAVIHAALRFYRLYGDIFRGLDARHAALAEAA